VAHFARSASSWLAVGAGLAAASYAAYVGSTWLRYGSSVHPTGEDMDPLLDRFMPVWEAVDCHQKGVAAPADITMAAASDMDLQQSTIVRAIFKVRELILGGRADNLRYPPPLLDQVKAMGWGVLAEVPGREIVFGAVTQPWVANVVFRALRPDEFAAFKEPGYVKIVWTLRADPISAGASIARTETRVATTDPAARAIFRRYWSFFSPGMKLIRRVWLGLAKAEAERRSREARSMQQHSGLQRI
jgi:hypothetical protein